MSILEKVRNHVTKRNADASAELLDIARREAAGKARKADADRVIALLETTGTPAERFEQLVATVKEVAELEPLAAGVAEAEAEYTRANRERGAFNEETLRIAKERKARFHGELWQAVMRAETAMKQAAQARDRMRQIKVNNPEMFQ